MYSYTVFIGRFQPLHVGHVHVMQKALEQSERLLVLVGSPYKPRSTRNPFTFDERQAMILNTFPDRVIVAPVEDHMYNEDRWIQEVQEIVYLNTPKKGKIALVGYAKDHTSYYLKAFPQWDSIDVEPMVIRNYEVNSTDIREEYFNYGNYSYVADSTARFLSSFLGTDEYDSLCNEFEFIRKYKESWKAAPYPPTFVTTDAVVVQSGHVLLVRRGAEPGKGQYALPGGFLNQTETIIDGTIRELREETKLKVPAPVLKGSIKARRVFDDPNRSTRGRTVTHATLFELTPQTELPKVKGSDDADKAIWLPLANLDSEKMYEDHYHIIKAMIGTS